MFVEFFFDMQTKMEAEGIATSAISAFESTFTALASGATGMIPESTIAPVPDLDKSAEFQITADTALLKQTVMLKLNGGLGTGMGLDKAKSLLKVKGDDTFLDLTAQQVLHMRKEHGFKVKFMLMNSFSTSKDTLDFLQANYPALAYEEGLEMLQNKVPKIDATTLEVRIQHAGETVVKDSCSYSTAVLFLVFDSPLSAKATPTMNGVLPVTVICTLPWSLLVAWTSCWPKDTSTCLSPTRTTWVPPSIWIS